VPLRFCGCTGCAACPPGKRSHTFDVDSSPGHQRCAPCQAVVDKQRDQQRGTTGQRGYGSAHQRKRAELVAAFVAGQPCARCQLPIWRAEDADLGHTDARDGWTGLEHARECNRAAGGRSRRGGRSAAQARRTAPDLYEPAADTDGDDDDEWSIGIA
jgi:hypothetical protein